MAAPPAATNVWRKAAAGEVELECWSGEYIVYNPLSGNTHILDIVSGKLLERILLGEIGTGTLCELIADFLDLPNDARMAENVEKTLAVLDDLGLIEPARGC